MRIERRSLMRLAAGAALALTLPPRPRAQPLSVAELRIIVGFPRGGPLDIAARIIASPLSARLGVPVTVENRPGASGNNATQDVVRAAPDGATLILCGPVNTINTTLFPDLGFDFVRDITPVAGIARVPLIVEVHPSVPVRSVPELIAHARANPGALRVAYAGTGTPQHVAIELFQHMAGVRFTLVPYPGSAQALADLLDGRAQVMFDPAPSSMPHVRAGRLIPLATTGPARAGVLPEVPTVAETMPGYEGGSWFGLGAPRGTSAEAVARLNAAVNAGLAEDAVREELGRLGGSPMPGSPATFGAFVVSETARYAEIIRIAGIRAG
ncbi:Bug family tripartite tricarboxylate transporter substrate binding protein [Muricoccus pecuniae]|uniref:Tripartite-type tricarboxylate transporter receptor subunit TctC n=1 Tax=Muricoccus pecuniae TaxID=693023 RepID=A0A840YIY4_9PROT|nr:tripartite tricarboxylate transporter substrate-binding protein [Roseomonas pecuniae]MBB5696521.1 tripartite-type tricarboxylate transporter receptor subunit TctC [Roseomonas pecuniae]